MQRRKKTFLAGLTASLARAGQVATDVYGTRPAPSTSKRRKSKCTPCEAMQRRARAEAHVRGLRER